MPTRHIPGPESCHGRDDDSTPPCHNDATCRQPQRAAVALKLQWEQVGPPRAPFQVFALPSATLRVRCKQLRPGSDGAVPRLYHWLRPSCYCYLCFQVVREWIETNFPRSVRCNLLVGTPRFSATFFPPRTSPVDIKSHVDTTAAQRTHASKNKT